MPANKAQNPANEAQNPANKAQNPAKKVQIWISALKNLEGWPHRKIQWEVAKRKRI